MAKRDIISFTQKKYPGDADMDTIRLSIKKDATLQLPGQQSASVKISLKFQAFGHTLRKIPVSRFFKKQRGT